MNTITSTDDYAVYSVIQDIINERYCQCFHKLNTCN